MSDIIIALNRHAFTVAVALVFTATKVASAIQADDAFIEGFPDIPKLASFAGFEIEPVVFDTQSGTVAEAHILLHGKPDSIFNEYSRALASLGWQCTLLTNALDCERDKNHLSLSYKGSGTSDSPTAYVLRVEPKS